MNTRPFVYMMYFLLLGSMGYGSEVPSPAKLEDNYDFVYQTDDESERKVVLGQGLMAMVHLARPRDDRERRVAIRTIQKASLRGIDRETDIVDLEREALRLQKTLDHPAILCVEIYETTAELHAVFPLMEGFELYDLIKNQCLPRLVATSYLQRILDGVGYLHQQGILHRDLKPENIMFAKKSGKYPEAADLRIIDFGFAIKKDKVDPINGVVVGTYGYIAPETLLYHAYREESDVWAIGCIFYAMLMGELPFAITTPIDPAAWECIEKGNYLTKSRFDTLPKEYIELLDIIFKSHVSMRRRPSCEAIQKKYPWTRIPEEATSSSLSLESLAPLLPQPIATSSDTQRDSWLVASPGEMLENTSSVCCALQ
jgi:serine/threonine protein kinase